LLEYPNPPAEHPTLKPKSCGRVLTSAQNFKLMEVKEAKKLEQRRLKEERKLQRERKKELAAQKKKKLRRKRQE